MAGTDMAGRPMNKLHQADVRSKIQASQLVNRLTDHALGHTELSNTQVRAIEILLKKTIPDLQSVELTGDPDKPVGFQLIERRVIDAGN